MHCFISLTLPHQKTESRLELLWRLLLSVTHYIFGRVRQGKLLLKNKWFSAIITSWNHSENLVKKSWLIKNMVELSRFNVSDEQAGLDQGVLNNKLGYINQKDLDESRSIKTKA